MARIKRFSVLLFVVIFMITGCGEKQTTEKPVSDTDATITVSDRKVIKEEEFGGVYIDLTIDEFNKPKSHRYGGKDTGV